jgi:hypothetical protein
MATARRFSGGAGTQTAGLGFGGYITGTGGTGATEEYNGSTWSPSNPLNTARYINRRSRNANSRFGFWWIFYSCYRGNRRI